MKKLVSIAFLFFSLNGFSSTAKIVLAKGKVFGIKDGKSTPLKRGDSVAEYTSIKTEPKSVARVKLPDNSNLTVGPRSEILIEKFKTNKDPSLISVVGGMVRSSVPKEINQDTKMLIKTKSAVMGIRGTELQVIYNPVNQVSSTITFSGLVAMAEAPPRGRIADFMKNLAASPHNIGPGQISTTNMKAGFKVTPPTKLSPVQFEALKRNDTFKEAKVKVADNSKKIVPPGLNTKKAAPAAEEIEKKLNVEVSAEQSSEIQNSSDAPKKDAPLAGGFVDLKTGLYVPPPPGSTFDANAGVYVPSEDLGKIDPETGDLVLTEGTEIADDGTVVDTETGEAKEGVAQIDLDVKEDDLEIATDDEGASNDESEIEIVEAEPDVLDDPVLEDTDDTFDDEREVTSVNVNIKVKLQ